MVALTLARRADHRVTVLDLGGRWEPECRAAQAPLPTDEAAWDGRDLGVVTARVPTRAGDRVPRKRVHGSDYPLRDRGQSTGVRGRPADTHLDVASSAYGGFTNVWGTQVMPFAPATFDRLPISWPEMDRHYRTVLEEVPLAGEDDDLAESFPLLHPGRRLPPQGPRAVPVLVRYDAHRTALRQRGSPRAGAGWPCARTPAPAAR